MEKKCSKCKKTLPLNLFHKDKNTKSGFRSHCIECIKLDKEKNKEINAIKSRERYLKNKDKIRLRYLEAKDIIAQKNKEYYSKNRESILKQKKEYNKKSPEVKRTYYEKNKVKINKRGAETHAIRRKNNPILKFSHNTSTIIRHSFKRKFDINSKKTKKTESILGCSIDFFIDYIKSKFNEGMTIENHGEWHLDHIIPISSAKTEEDAIRLNHYTNFQPLWAFDNLSKGKKLLR